MKLINRLFKLRPRVKAGYLKGLKGGSSMAFLGGPRPQLRNADEDVREAWGMAAVRAIEVIHNNGWIAGVTEQMISLIIGEGLKPNFKPDLSFTGWEEARVQAWAMQAEKSFAAYICQPQEVDASARWSFAQIQAAVLRSWFATGEIVAEFPYFHRIGTTWNSRLRLLPSHWLSQTSRIDENIQHGVILDRHGATAGYVFSVKDPLKGWTEIKRAARDGYGRTKVLHIFDGQVGQVRGITPFAPILRVLRDYDQLSNATLTASMIHAIFAATVESDYPTSEIFDALSSPDEIDKDAASRFGDYLNERMGWYQNEQIDLSYHGKIAHMMPGERLNLNRPAHPNSSYEPFANALLREIARATGALFEDLTGDFRGASYSSIRMGIAKQWPLILYRRRHLVAPLCQAVFSAWLEEEIDRGALPLPGGIDAFVANRGSIVRVEWRGPAKPVADEIKSAKAHECYRNMGVITDEIICNDLGHDVDDIYRDRAKERDRRQQMNIHGGITNGGSDQDGKDAEDDAGRAENLGEQT